MEYNKRKTIRIDKSFVVMYTFDFAKNNNKKWDMAIVRDISETGMQLTTMRRLSSKALIKFLIKIPFNPFQWIELNGKAVVDSKELKSSFKEAVTDTHITRIKFIGLKDDTNRLLRKYIEWFDHKKKKAIKDLHITEHKKVSVDKCPLCGVFPHP